MQNEAEKVPFTLPNMRQIEWLFMRVNHNNRALGYLQQLAYFTETCKEWQADSAGKGLKNELQNRTCRLLLETHNLYAPPPDSALVITNPDHIQLAFQSAQLERPNIRHSGGSCTCDISSHSKMSINGLCLP